MAMAEAAPGMLTTEIVLLKCLRTGMFMILPKTSLPPPAPHPTTYSMFLLGNLSAARTAAALNITVKIIKIAKHFLKTVGFIFVPSF
jgi:hypothetical protein